MPLQKFRSFDEMPRMERVGEAELTARIRTLWARASLLCPRTLTRGVRRFRSIEEANAERERETAERMRARAATG